MKVLLWHVHGSWTTSFVHGDHDVVVPVNEARDSDGLGLARTFHWPSRVAEVPLEQLRSERFDVVVLQRPREVELCAFWTGRRPGVDIPAVYVEHNTPGAGAVTTRHCLAGRADIPIVHVTHTNRLLWDSGWAPTLVIEHGIVDPGYQFTGAVPRAAVVVNDPVRRGRPVGADLIAQVCRSVPVDLFGMGVAEFAARHSADLGDRLRAFEDLPQDDLHTEIAQRRVYVHLHRWTSLGLSLLEAMHLGMPIVALATTEVPRAVPPSAGVASPRVSDLRAAARRFVRDRAAGTTAGRAARDHALTYYGLERFLREWGAVLHDVVAGWHATSRSPATAARSHW